jgi:alkanesulfonate monooxygenase SsuD/methylene tetrahydromethanopterin reductase-like flavin-dependent oxidoreductase (luciferase family)
MNAVQFGLNIDPNTDLLQDNLRRAALADSLGLDMISIQDHPYQRRFLDTWTLLTFLGARTQRVKLGTNVANLPLRPPAMLAKAAATLDVLTGGRVELGLGAGAFWQAIEAWGVPARSPGEAYQSMEDALHIMRGMWRNAGRTFSHEGQIYSVKGVQPGPAPAHDIPVWVGALGPRMLRLTGRMADGIWLSSTYVPVSRLAEMMASIDEGAAEAGRSPDAVRRGYNLMGIIDDGTQGSRPSNLGEGTIYGTPQEWADTLVMLYQRYRQDTFNFWPVGGDPERQIRLFAEEVAPAVRQALR